VSFDELRYLYCMRKCSTFISSNQNFNPEASPRGEASGCDLIRLWSRVIL